MLMTNQTVDMSQYQNTGELGDSVGISKIQGEEIFITGFKHTRGKPTSYTQQKDIGTDGKTDYYTINTSKSFKIDGEDVNSFFVTPAIVAQINRVPNVVEILANGGRLGPVKAGKKQSQKDATKKYWCLLFPNEEGY